MDKNNENKTEHITSEDLAEQTKVILEAIDARFNDSRRELYAVRNELKADIKNVQDELYIVRNELKTDINNVQTLIDGYVKAQEDFKQEFVIMKEEIRLIKQVFKQKLGVEIRAF